MSFTQWLSKCVALSSRTAPARKSYPARRTARLCLECLEDRCVPSTLTVANNHDSGVGSLRADIAAAHNGDTILFAPSLNGQTITLTSGELLINHNLTISGPGASNLTISGNHASRVFEVAKTTRAVALSGLTISDGSAQIGGGILNGGTLTVSGSILSGNSARQGGGIDNDGTLTVTGSTLSGNVAAQGYGGGMASFGTLTVSGSTLSGNSAGEGGGIYNGSPSATISDSVLSGNSAYAGGAIYDIGGYPLTISGSTLSNNSASYGGGIDNRNGVLTISGSTLSGNSASWEGGGILNYVNGKVTVKNSSSITGNTAPAGFGADADNLGVLYLDSTSTIGVLNGNAAIPI